LATIDEVAAEIRGQLKEGRRPRREFQNLRHRFALRLFVTHVK